MPIVSNLSQFGYIKKPVRTASVVNVSLSSPGGTIGSVTLAAGDANLRVLLTNQSNAHQNGIYDWNGDSSPLTRALDASVSEMFSSGFAVLVAEGADAGAVYQYQGPSNPTLGSTNLTFVRVNPSATTVTVRDIDGTPTVSASTIEFTNGTVTDQGSGVARVSIPSSVTVSEQDGSPLVTASQIKFPNGAVTESPSGTANISFPSLVVNAGTDRSTDKLVFTHSGTVVITEASYDAPSKTLTLNFDGASGGGGSTPRAHYPLAQPSGALAGSTNFLSSIPTNWNNSFNPGGYTVTNAVTDYGLLITHTQTGSSGTTMRLAGIYNSTDFPAVGDSVRAFITIESPFTADQSGSTNSGYAFLALLENTSSLATADIYGIGLRTEGNTMSGGYYAYSSYNATFVSNQISLGIGAQNSSGVWVAIHREATNDYSFWLSGNGISWRAFFRGALTFTGTSPAIALLLSNSAANSSTDKTQRMRCLSLQRINSAPSPVGVIQ